MSCHERVYDEKAAEDSTYPADDIIVVGKVCLAILTAVDLVGVQVDIVCKAHPKGRP